MQVKSVRLSQLEPGECDQCSFGGVQLSVSDGRSRRRFNVCNGAPGNPGQAVAIRGADGKDGNPGAPGGNGLPGPSFSSAYGFFDAQQDAVIPVGTLYPLTQTRQALATSLAANLVTVQEPGVYLVTYTVTPTTTGGVLTNDNAQAQLVVNGTTVAGTRNISGGTAAGSTLTQSTTSSALLSLAAGDTVGIINPANAQDTVTLTVNTSFPDVSSVSITLVQIV